MPPKMTASFPDTEPMTQPVAYGEDFDADTQPMPLMSTSWPEPLTLAPPQIALYDLLAEIRKDGRVCPLPTRWLAFYRLLEAHADGTALPPAPLTGSAWAATPALAKRMCLREQVEWTASHNCMNAAWLFLKQLPQADWHTMK